MQNNALNDLAGQQEFSRESAIGAVLGRSIERRRATAQAEIERLVAAALVVIRKTGRLEPTVHEILAEAGLSNQAFYRHFRSKHELLVAVLDEGIRSLARYLRDRMAKVDAPSGAIREWIRGLAAQAANPDGAEATRPFVLARAKLAESFPAEVARSATQVTEPLREALDAARDSGELANVEPKRDAEALYLLVMGFVEARLLEGRIPEASEVDHLESFILAGLGRPLAGEAKP